MTKLLPVLVHIRLKLKIMLLLYFIIVINDGGKTNDKICSSRTICKWSSLLL